MLTKYIMFVGETEMNELGTVIRFVEGRAVYKDTYSSLLVSMLPKA